MLSGKKEKKEIKGIVIRALTLSSLQERLVSGFRAYIIIPMIVLSKTDGRSNNNVINPYIKLTHYLFIYLFSSSIIDDH